MSLTDLLVLTGAIAFTMVIKYAPGLVHSWRIRFRAWRIRRIIRRTDWGDALADIDAIAKNERNGIISTLSKATGP